MKNRDSLIVVGGSTRPYRRHMDPWSLELLIMLRSNKDMWGYGTLKAIIDRRKKQNSDAVSKRQREEDSEMEENVLTLLMRKTYAIASSAKYHQAEFAGIPHRSVEHQS